MPASGSGSLEFTDDVTADRRINYEVNCHQNNLQSFWYQNFENATVLVYYRLKLMSATHVYKCSSPSLHSFSGQPARTRQDIVSECDVTTRRNISFITCQRVCLWISQQPTLFNHFTTYGNNIGNVKAILTAIVHVLRVSILYMKLTMPASKQPRGHVLCLLGFPPGASSHIPKTNWWFFTGHRPICEYVHSSSQGCWPV